MHDCMSCLLPLRVSHLMFVVLEQDLKRGHEGAQKAMPLGLQHALQLCQDWDARLHQVLSHHGPDHLALCCTHCRPARLLIAIRVLPCRPLSRCHLQGKKSWHRGLPKLMTSPACGGWSDCREYQHNLIWHGHKPHMSWVAGSHTFMWGLARMRRASPSTSSQAGMLSSPSTTPPSTSLHSLALVAKRCSGAMCFSSILPPDSPL